MFQMLVNLIIGIVSLLLNLILAPIDLIISANIPDVLPFYESFQSFLFTVKNVMNWVVSFSGLSSQAIDLLVAYFLFITISNISVRPIKLFINWWNSLK